MTVQGTLPKEYTRSRKKKHTACHPHPRTMIYCKYYLLLEQKQQTPPPGFCSVLPCSVSHGSSRLLLKQAKSENGYGAFYTGHLRWPSPLLLPVWQTSCTCQQEGLAVEASAELPSCLCWRRLGVCFSAHSASNSEYESQQEMSTWHPNFVHGPNLGLFFYFAPCYLISLWGSCFLLLVQVLSSSPDP